MNEQLKSQPNSVHYSDRIKNGVITPGSFITADSRGLSYPSHIKQLTMTLNALLASTESVFGASLRKQIGRIKPVTII